MHKNKEVQKLIEVKNNLAIGRLIIFFCVLPIFFFVLANILEQYYILTLGLMFPVCSLMLAYFFMKIKREANLNIIEADENNITITDKGTFGWSSISEIKVFTKIKLLENKTSKYIQFKFHNQNILNVDASYFDIDYLELKQKLEALRTNINS